MRRRPADGAGRVKCDTASNGTACGKGKIYRVPSYRNLIQVKAGEHVGSNR